MTIENESLNDAKLPLSNDLHTASFPLEIPISKLEGIKKGGKIIPVSFITTADTSEILLALKRAYIDSIGELPEELKRWVLFCLTKYALGLMYDSKLSESLFQLKIKEYVKDNRLFKYIKRVYARNNPTTRAIIRVICEEKIFDISTLYDCVKEELGEESCKLILDLEKTVRDKIKALREREFIIGYRVKDLTNTLTGHRLDHKWLLKIEYLEKEHIKQEEFEKEWRKLLAENCKTQKSLPKRLTFEEKNQAKLDFEKEKRLLLEQFALRKGIVEKQSELNGEIAKTIASKLSKIKSEEYIKAKAPHLQPIEFKMNVSLLREVENETDRLKKETILLDEVKEKVLVCESFSEIRVLLLKEEELYRLSEIELKEWRANESLRIKREAKTKENHTSKKGCE